MLRLLCEPRNNCGTIIFLVYAQSRRQAFYFGTHVQRLDARTQLNATFTMREQDLREVLSGNEMEFARVVLDWPSRAT